MLRKSLTLAVVIFFLLNFTSNAVYEISPLRYCEQLRFYTCRIALLFIKIRFKFSFGIKLKRKYNGDNKMWKQFDDEADLTQFISGTDREETWMDWHGLVF